MKFQSKKDTQPSVGLRHVMLPCISFSSETKNYTIFIEDYQLRRKKGSAGMPKEWTSSRDKSIWIFWKNGNCRKKCWSKSLKSVLSTRSPKDKGSERLEKKGDKRRIWNCWVKTNWRKIQKIWTTIFQSKRTDEQNRYRRNCYFFTYI